MLECDGKMVFSIPINKNMINKNETAKVKKKTDCIITVINFGPIWYANYTVINEGGTTVNIRRQDENSIPTEIGELTLLSNLTLGK